MLDQHRLLHHRNTELPFRQADRRRDIHQLRRAERQDIYGRSRFDISSFASKKGYRLSPVERSVAIAGVHYGRAVYERRGDREVEEADGRVRCGGDDYDGDGAIRGDHELASEGAAVGGSCWDWGTVGAAVSDSVS